MDLMKTQELISQAYAAFNRRDVEGVLALMCDDVSWPKASEGGRVVGKQEIREYWTRQWVVFDPRLEVLAIVDRDDAKTEVKVRQLVLSIEGDVLSDGELWHVYTLRDGLIARMDILEPDGLTEGRFGAQTSHVR